MLLKPLHFILVYVIVVTRLTVSLLPIGILIYLILFFIGSSKSDMMEYLNGICLCTIFLVSLYTAMYLFIDFIFGLSTRKICGTKYIEYSHIPTLMWIDPIFKDAKRIFDTNNVQLYISKDESLNAFAVGSMRSNKIVITTGLIDYISSHVLNKRERFLAIAGIISHEMSHIINMDFLPGLLLSANQRFSDTIERVCNNIINSAKAIFGIVPIIGRIPAMILGAYYYIVKSILNLGQQIIIGLSDTIALVISKNIEYRSDADAAMAFGPEGIGLALGIMRFNTYNSIFSTHPNINSRIKRVMTIEHLSPIILPSNITTFTNTIAITFSFVIVIYIGYMVKVWNLYHYLVGIKNALILYSENLVVSIGELKNMFSTAQNGILELKNTMDSISRITGK